MNNEILKALTSNSIEYYPLKGKHNKERCQPLNEYAVLREKYGVQPYGYATMHSPIAPYVMASIDGQPPKQFLNFSSQDYLGLSQNDEVKTAAKQVIDQLGIHTASSPAFTGRNYLIEKLENKLATVLQTDQAILFPTGWMACFGAIVSLIGPNDAIFLDAYAHNSLQTAAKNATHNIYKFHHNDLNHLEQLLKKYRDKFKNSGLFVVVESLYSMHADIIDLKGFLEITKKYDANLFLDIAHDFGVLGQKGLGVLEDVDISEREDIVIIGAFTKAFATNGGFIAGKNYIRGRTMLFSPSYTFSNSISPLQTAIALKSAEIIFSEKGKILRNQLSENIDFMTNQFKKQGFTIIGKKSPIIPVLIGDIKLARLIYRENLKQGLLVNLAEFPAVPRNQSLFRFQMMSTHTKEHILEAIKKFSTAKQNAEHILQEILKN